MKVMVTGANGQLGKDLLVHLGTKYKVVGLGRNEMDITDLDACQLKMIAEMPDVVIHAAAHTAVDDAETDVDTAYAINSFGSRNMAIAAEAIGAKICFISTDYVFDGLGDSPYREYDIPNPQSIYGKSKLAAEQMIASLSSRYFIVRTSWVFGIHGNNFVKTMLKLGSERDTLKIVCDQVGTPTYTVDLCNFLGELVATDKFGIYHASNSGQCSWFEFAEAIFEEAGLTLQVLPCKTDDFPRPAPRPKYSVMDHQSIRINGFTDLPPWRNALERFLSEEKLTLQQYFKVKEVKTNL